jgi:hypothetical protein
VAPAVGQVFPEVARRFRLLRGSVRDRRPPQDQRDADGGDGKRDRVQREEVDDGHDGQQQAGKSRPQQPGEAGGGIHQPGEAGKILRRHEARQHGVQGGLKQGAKCPHAEPGDHQVPGLQGAQPPGQRQGQDQDGPDGIHGHHGVQAAPAVEQGAAHQPHQDGGHGFKERHGSHGRRGACEFVRQPEYGHHVKPVAGGAGDLTGPEQQRRRAA